MVVAFLLNSICGVKLTLTCEGARELDVSSTIVNVIPSIMTRLHYLSFQGFVEGYLISYELHYYSSETGRLLQGLTY